ncbi:hypothetical protein BDN70DRAFT_872780 [Pholiota conissans]|uniref:Uncharacterized protein n=1 Tax=Pholiota conissans TaxID=109636 RepID=A0A9P6D588_9AGAR|nr:hypothetical protein BDN70DRAFT_872780 [Pholiota conissans]
MAEVDSEPLDNNSFQSIRCKLGNDAVWEHLIAHPESAARVEELEMMRENPSGYRPLDEEERVPAEILGSTLSKASGKRPEQGPATREHAVHSEGLLIRAIHNMVNLASFTWDRWVPVINQGDDVTRSRGREYGNHTEQYREDIWTVLRDRTQLRRLKVVDLGRRNACFTDPRPIFDSTLFTLGNLTHLDFKMYYSPEDPREGENGADDEDSDEELLLPRVKVERIYELLRRCPDIQTLRLAIIDRDFYWNLDGNPYTNISLIFSHLHLSHISSLTLQDVTVDDNIIVRFLNTHPSVRALSASLSLSEEDLPETPFNLESNDGLYEGILPNITSLHLPPKDLRPVLRALRRPSPITSLGILEPQDWYAAEELDDDENYVSSLDDVWGAPPEGQESEIGPSRGRDLHNLLTDMPDLRELTIMNVTTFAQLHKLASLTPNLESVTSIGKHIHTSYVDPHFEYLPHLSRWPYLRSLKGPCLWPEGYGIHSSKIKEVTIEIAAACRRLSEASWLDGKLVKIVRREDGEAELEFMHPQ